MHQRGSRRVARRLRCRRAAGHRLECDPLPREQPEVGDGVSAIPSLREAQVNVALGTDGRGCYERLDVLELAALAMATEARTSATAGPRAIGRPTRLPPGYDFQRQVIHGAESGDLMSVIIAGKVIVDRGRVYFDDRPGGTLKGG